MTKPTRSGPLSGLTVIEMAGLGPVPLAALMLSDMGADIVRIERLGAARPFLSLPPRYDLDRHGRSILRIDLKRDEGVALVGELARKADVLIEGFRPGVMERLHLGPDTLMAGNPKLIYGRMTGFGQDGPLAGRAGHDITYLALSGVLHAIGPADKPIPPLNLIGDYGGGAMMLISGVLAALFSLSRTGMGQIVDAAMVEGASMLAAPFHAFLATGLWQDKRGMNLLDGGAPFYDTYATADGKHVAVGCLEPQFFAEFATLLPLDACFVERQYDRATWPAMREQIAGRIAGESRDHWDALFAPTDACVAPVLSFAEARKHTHNRARHAFVVTDGLERPAPTPRFSATPGHVSMAPADENVQPAPVLSRLGVDQGRIEVLAKSGVVG